MKLFALALITAATAQAHAAPSQLDVFCKTRTRLYNTTFATNVSTAEGRVSVDQGESVYGQKPVLNEAYATIVTDGVLHLRAVGPRKTSVAVKAYLNVPSRAEYGRLARHSTIVVATVNVNGQGEREGICELIPR